MVIGKVAKHNCWYFIIRAKSYTPFANTMGISLTRLYQKNVKHTAYSMIFVKDVNSLRLIKFQK